MKQTPRKRSVFMAVISIRFSVLRFFTGRIELNYHRWLQFISEILKWRAQSTADHVIFTLLNAKGAAAAMLTCSQLHKRAERIGSLLQERAKINTGDHVALIFPPGIDLICAFYGCLYVGELNDRPLLFFISRFVTYMLTKKTGMIFVGAVPVTIRPPHPQNLQTTLPTVRMIVDVSKSVLVLSNQNVIKLLKSKVSITSTYYWLKGMIM